MDCQELIILYQEMLDYYSDTVIILACAAAIELIVFALVIYYFDCV